MNNTQLIQACIKGERHAQRLLFDKYAQELYNIASRYAGQSVTPDDIAQESWIKIFRKLGTYKDEGRLDAWMKKIVINTALEKLRLKWHKSVVLSIEPMEDMYTPPEIIQSMEAQEILSIVNKLPDGYREIFKLHAIEGYKHKEIGEILGIQPSTSRAKLTLAKKKLRDILFNANKLAQ